MTDSQPAPVPHMDPESFRRHGHEVVDWVADYLATVESRPVTSTVAPGDVAGLVPPCAPEKGESFDTIMADVDRVVLPGITHWQSPNWFAYFPSNASGPSILADLVSSGLGVQGMLWATSPACTELETRMLDWMAHLLGIGDRFLSTGAGGGVIQDTASSSAICTMLAARDRAAPGTQAGLQGVEGILTAYTSSQAHSSIEKGAGILGIGRDNLRIIDVDEHFAMCPRALRSAIESDLAAGRKPFYVSATVGTTASGAMDPLEDLLAICREFDLWLHVDGAMFGTAACCEEFRWIQRGCEQADSYTVNPHKWMLVNFDCNCLWVADRQALISSLSILPEYLRNQATATGDVIDYRDWQIPLGRRFRALKLWFVLRHYGAEGIRQMVREHVAMTQELVEWINAHEAFEVVAPSPLTLVCFSHVDGDDRTQAILEQANATGTVALSHARLNDRYVIRLNVGQWRTRPDHVRAAWDLLTSLSS
ncbi:MAG: pyridoxal-dependent decarboxylase [Phycisphaerales bacterium]|nr:pyridoxal-dependent decarboxylase [Phycisphaerales bacterium]